MRDEVAQRARQPRLIFPFEEMESGHAPAFCRTNSRSVGVTSRSLYDVEQYEASQPGTHLSQDGAQSTSQTLLLTAVAMIAFAANSLLCRMALGAGLIDAGSFASLRTLAGALTLAAILAWRGNLQSAFGANHWRTGAMLFAYMVFFTFAYRSLSAGTGALILFGAVQLTMFVAAMRSGEAFSLISWGGLALAVAGLVYLVSPGLTAPDLLSALLMAVAGIAWGLYSLLGRSAGDPLTATAGAFIAALPAVLVVGGVAGAMNSVHVDTTGVLLAIASGAVASGLGYVVWYAALRGLTAARAATVQLSVPVIAAIGGILFIGEDITLRLVVASIATLGGVAIVLAQRTAKRA
jgi:drug/metabolite transporter (DMT)-like permease